MYVHNCGVRACGPLLRQREKEKEERAAIELDKTMAATRMFPPPPPLSLSLSLSQTLEAVAIKQISLKSVPGRLSNIRQKEIAILKVHSRN